MSDHHRPTAEQMRDGVVQLRFADNDGHVKAINAKELAEVLEGMVEFTSEMAKAGLFGDGLHPVVRVRTPKEGSFVLEFIVNMMNSDPVGATGLILTTGGGVGQALRMGIKKLRGDHASDFEYLENGNVKVQWASGTVDEVPRAAWKKLNTMSRKTRGELRKIMAPLGDDVDKLEVRDGEVGDSTSKLLATEPEVVADRAVYREAAIEVDEIEDGSRTIPTEAVLKSIDFRPGKKWRVATTSEGTRLATMDDEDFLREIEDGHPIHKDDIFEVQIRETTVTKNGRTKREWSLIDVRRKKRGADGDDADAPRSPRE